MWFMISEVFTEGRVVRWGQLTVFVKRSHLQPIISIETALTCNVAVTHLVCILCSAIEL